MVGAFLPPTQPPTEGANGGGVLTSPNPTFRELAQATEAHSRYQQHSQMSTSRTLPIVLTGEDLGTK